MRESPARTMRIGNASAPGTPQGDRALNAHVWTVLLAGGDGTRLLGSLVDGVRIDRPKQFCHFGRDDSLLGSTLARARSISGGARILPVVSEAHRAWWTSELRHLPRENVLVQPRGRGTAVALLHALIHVLLRDEQPMIVVLPCDHGVADEDVLLRATERAIAAAAEPPAPLVLVGIAPTSPEPQYGWIVPGPGGTSTARSVQRFVEKPSLRDACTLMERGGLWNSLIFAISGRALLERFLETTPRLVEGYLWKMRDREWSEQALLECFASLSFTDLSRDILERSVPHLRVVPVRGSGWTDLGTPDRLGSWLRRQRRGAANAREGSPMRLLNP